MDSGGCRQRKRRIGYTGSAIRVLRLRFLLRFLPHLLRHEAAA